MPIEGGAHAATFAATAVEAALLTKKYPARIKEEVIAHTMRKLCTAGLGQAAARAFDKVSDPDARVALIRTLVATHTVGEARAILTLASAGVSKQ